MIVIDGDDELVGKQFFGPAYKSFNLSFICTQFFLILKQIAAQERNSKIMPKK
jgi:hypothetical protein